MESATPSLAVQMVGLNSVPTAGDEFYVCEDETMARKAAEVAEDAQVQLMPLMPNMQRYTADPPGQGALQLQRHKTVALWCLGQYEHGASVACM